MKRIMDVFIKAIEYYLPTGVVTNEELEKNFPEWNAEKVTKKTGISERHITSSNETATDLAYEAAIRLFDSNPGIKDSINFLLLCTQSPDYKLPTSACILQNRLRLPTSIGAFDYNLGCSGCVYGLAIAKSLIMAGVAKNVLLLTAETYSKYFHPKDKGNKSLFGDGAAAMCISTEGIARIGEFVLGTDGSGEDNLKVKTGGARFPVPLNEEAYDSNGYILSSDHLYMNGAQIFVFTQKNVPRVIEDVLARNNLKKEEIDLFILHQANSYMLDFLRKKMHIDEDKFYMFMENVGNTVSNSIPICLAEAQGKGRLCGNVVLCGFGVGYSWGAVVVAIN